MIVNGDLILREGEATDNDGTGEIPGTIYISNQMNKMRRT